MSAPLPLGRRAAAPVPVEDPVLGQLAEEYRAAKLAADAAETAAEAAKAALLSAAGEARTRALLAGEVLSTLPIAAAGSRVTVSWPERWRPAGEAAAAALADRLGAAFASEVERVETVACTASPADLRALLGEDAWARAVAAGALRVEGTYRPREGAWARAARALRETPEEGATLAGVLGELQWGASIRLR